MKIKSFFDKATFTLTYVIYSEEKGEAAIIDPVMDFDPASGKITDDSVKEVIQFLKQNKLKPTICLETHAHADHLSGSQLLKREFPGLKVGISKRITEVQKIFSKVFNFDIQVDGSQFDYLISDFEVMEFAGFEIQELPTPGHTPACSSFLVNKSAVFTGDALFMPDYGVGRCDFPGGSAKTLYHSITQNLFSLPDATLVFVGHDYQPNNRELKYESTIGEEKERNIQLNASTSEQDFILKRETRDRTLNAPRLLLPSIQVNILAGRLPEADTNGQIFLKIPVKPPK